MKQLNINKLPDVLNFTVMLEADAEISGVLRLVSSGSTPTDIPGPVAPVTGTTTSKLKYIKKSFAPGDVYLGKQTTIRGTDIQAKITIETIDYVKYFLYLDTGFEIMYEDKTGTTTFSFVPPNTTLGVPNDATAFMLAYSKIIDAPKLDSNLFINRGVNNVFESFQRFKTAMNLQELQKTGFGFFKQYKNGIN